MPDTEETLEVTEAAPDSVDGVATRRRNRDDIRCMTEVRDDLIDNRSIGLLAVGLPRPETLGSADVAGSQSRSTSATTADAVRSGIIATCAP
jgi:hypothetical protein